MTGNSGDPVPTISESAATGSIAELYADIRATQGVPVVNLIWRHLATFPGGLEWGWNALKPLYASGAIDAAANALRDGLTLPELPEISRSVLYAVGLDDDDIAQIMTVLRAYERSNAMNMVALSALLARLEGTGKESTAAREASAAPAGVDGQMPPLLALDELPPHLRDLANGLNKVGGRDDIMASMYRHLANWPPYLGVITMLLAPVAEARHTEPVILGVIAEGRHHGDALAAGLATTVRVPDEQTREDLRAAINRFIAGPIGKMITVVPLIRRAMPA